MQKDTNWHITDNRRKTSTRLFVAKALTNIHNVRHSPRCFKKGCVCYTKFPIEPIEKTIVSFAEESTQWTDFDGTPTAKWIFEVQLKRNIQDAYTNVHNRLLTMMFLCNNNVLAAMTGAAILYVTSYSSKKTQKEERMAFEKLANVLLQVIENQVSNQKRIYGDISNSL